MSLLNANYYILQGGKGAIFYLMDDMGGFHHNGLQQLNSTNESDTSAQYTMFGLFMFL